MKTAVLTDAERRAIARVAMREDRVPPWVADLALLPEPNFHAIDRLMHDGLVVWSVTGWRLTEAGRLALATVEPKESRLIRLTPRLPLMSKHKRLCERLCAACAHHHAHDHDDGVCCSGDPAPRDGLLGRDLTAKSLGLATSNHCPCPHPHGLEITQGARK